MTQPYTMQDAKLAGPPVIVLAGSENAVVYFDTFHFTEIVTQTYTAPYALTSTSGSPISADFSQPAVALGFDGAVPKPGDMVFLTADGSGVSAENIRFSVKFGSGNGADHGMENASASLLDAAQTESGLESSAFVIPSDYNGYLQIAIEGEDAARLTNLTLHKRYDDMLFYTQNELQGERTDIVNTTAKDETLWLIDARYQDGALEHVAIDRVDAKANGVTTVAASPDISGSAAGSAVSTYILGGAGFILSKETLDNAVYTPPEGLYNIVDAKASPFRPRLTWQSDGADATATTVTITWDTQTKTDTVVKYGTDESLSGIQKGNSVLSDTPVIGSGLYRHVAQLENLKPETVYYYSVGPDETGGYSETYSFQTAPEKGSDSAFRIGILSDSQEQGQNFGDGSDPTFAVTRAIANRLLYYQPDFVIHAGDMTDTSESGPRYTSFLNATSQLWAKAPVMFGGGNHDSVDVRFQDTLFLDGKNHPVGDIGSLGEAFSLPGNKMWYSYDYGNMHITNVWCGQTWYCADNPDWDTFTSPKFMYNGKTQLEWIEEDFAAAASDTDVTWKVLNIHMPLYGDGSIEIVREHLAPLVDKYGIDLVISGHVHSYARLKPIKNGEVVDSAVLSDGTYDISDNRATVYVTAASAGANLGGMTSSPYNVVAVNDYTFSILDVSGSTMTWTAYDRSGAEIDRFSITKTDSDR